MTSVPFCKFHGFGNDYIVVEREHLRGRDLGEFARAICSRNTGAGADGIAVLVRTGGGRNRAPEPQQEAASDFFCEIVNPDGSSASFSGNGTRCAVAFLYLKGIWSADTLRLATPSGVKNYRLIATESEGHYVFETEAGKPKFAGGEIPFASDRRGDEVIDHPVAVAGGQYTFSALNVGNPVACVFANSLDIDWRQIGRELESCPMFPERTNVVFVNVLDDENVDVRIWERGAGETAASGTCSLAAAVMSARQDKTGRTVNVHSPGGTTRVVWREDGEMVLTGRADLVYCGEWPS